MNPKPVVLDLETEAIEDRPAYPPVPAGVGIKYPGKKGVYYAWGHPTGNNCSMRTGELVIREAFNHPGGVVMHNAKFDLDVIETHFNIPPPRVIHDTMLLSYLYSPHEKSVALKTIGPKILGVEATERDELRDWIVANIRGATKKNWGAFIAKAPAELVAKYCDGDLRFTGDLFKYLYPKVVRKMGMGGPYQTELDMIPVLLQMERGGLRVDVEALDRDVSIYNKVLEQCNGWIRKYLSAKDLNVDSDEELADAIEYNYPGVQWVLTEKGHRSTSKENLPLAVGAVAPKLVAMMEYRSTLAKALSTYMVPWLTIAKTTGGLIYTQWNSTAQPEGGGTRTGRLSSARPVNLQNIFTEDTILSAEMALKILKLKWLLPFPRIRSYILPDSPDHVLIGRDLSQQEPRMLAYFENDVLEAKFQEDPMADVYVMMVGVLKSATGIEITRKAMKTLVLAIIYGLGLAMLAVRLNCSVDEAALLRKALYKAFPGIKDLQDDLKARASAGEPMRTWGGRIYYAEDPKIIKGIVRSFGYKLVNFLCQGSSADYTKQAMLRYDRMRRHGRLVLSVHDELVVSVPRAHWQSEMQILKTAMEDVPGMTFKMRSDGEVGPNWGSMVETEI